MPYLSGIPECRYATLRCAKVVLGFMVIRYKVYNEQHPRAGLNIQHVIYEQLARAQMCIYCHATDDVKKRPKVWKYPSTGLRVEKVENHWVTIPYKYLQTENTTYNRLKC